MEPNFSSLFEFLPIGAYRTRPDGVMVRANPALVRLNGYDNEAELLAAVVDIARHWYVQPGRRAEFQHQLARDGRVVGFESEVRRYKTREAIWVSENAHAVHDDQGGLRYYEGTVEEITDRVHKRATIERSRLQLQRLVTLIPGMVYHQQIAPDGRRRYSFVSDAVRDIYGVTPEEVMADGQLLGSMRLPEEHARIGPLVERSVRLARPLHYQLRIRARDGRIKWVEVRSSPAVAEDGAMARVGVLFDVTAAKAAEQALQLQAEQWKAALEASGDGVWDWHVQEGVEELSAQCLALYGYAPGQLPDCPGALDERTHADDVPRMRADREAHFAGRSERYVNEHRVRHRDGHWIWVLSRGMVIERDADGTPLRMVGTHTDITARKQAEALRAERDLAAAADRAKSAFLSRVSHELRTPLNAVLGFSQLLELEPGDGERQRRWVAQVLSSGRHLLALMDDVLDISSAQTGQLPMTVETLQLQPLVAEVRSMLSAAAAGSGISVHDDTAGAAPLALRGDRKRVLQVLSNLLSNAIKYNRRGGWVRLRAQHEGGMLVLEVADSGPGLDAHQRARLFEPFERLEAQRGTVPGTGLGLALSRQFAVAMGGGIEVLSEPGQGAVFRLSLPAG